MKKNLILIAIIIFFITSLIISQSVIPTLDILYEKIFNNNYEILENGVKVQYYTKNNLEHEKKRIIDIFLLDNYDEKVSKDSIYIDGNKNNIEFEIKGSLNNRGNFIEIQLIEKNNKINITKLQEKLYELKTNATTNEQYFTFIKGKLMTNSNEEIRLKNLFKEKKAKEIETIPISSGITSMVKLKNKLQINYSLSNYNSGTYLIVGTPIIFVEY